jgi:hypothetical protein
VRTPGIFEGFGGEEGGMMQWPAVVMVYISKALFVPWPVMDGLRLRLSTLTVQTVPYSHYNLSPPMRERLEWEPNDCLELR